MELEPSLPRLQGRVRRRLSLWVGGVSRKPRSVTARKQVSLSPFRDVADDRATVGHISAG